MVYDVYVNKAIQSPHTFLFDNLITLSESLTNELETIGVNKEYFARIINSEILERSKIKVNRSFGKRVRYDNCENISLFLIITLYFSDEVKYFHTIVSNFAGKVLIEIFDPGLLREALRLLPFNELECLTVKMPYLYQFFIFELIDYIKREILRNHDISIKIIKNTIIQLTSSKGLRILWNVNEPRVSIYSS